MGRDEVRDGTRRPREAPLGEEECGGARDATSDGESKWTRRRTLPLTVRQRGEATDAEVWGDTGGGVLSSAMVALCVDVGESRNNNPKIQSDASVLLQFNICQEKARQNKKLTK